MDAKENLVRAQEMAEALDLKTQQGKLRWDLRRGNESTGAEFATMISDYFYSVEKRKEVLILEIRQLNGPVVVHEEVSGEFGFETPFEERVYSTLKKLYDVVRRKAFDLDTKLEEARSLLRKL